MKGFIAAVLLLLVAGTTQAATWRCGNALASTGDASGEVLAKCGEPNRRDFLGYKEIIDRYGFSNEVEVEEWSYGPRNGMNYFLRFEGNRLQKIESKRGN
ncbi:DUF2845 domain-containing protein [Phytopseudomonas dryadis]|uniref:DUF2845 domain-containing protein n=1 Tax=Phytopseudomonas dryadis TaxID=2487520 RepID=A0A4V2KCX6_9GAMM|nr:DUF2845 domain-containing protein [Pseudomonas dryadis]TBU96689.1 hypothetical protein DNK44_03455 [Pseudomonas dryadis]